MKRPLRVQNNQYVVNLIAYSSEKVSFVDDVSMALHWPHARNNKRGKKVVLNKDWQKCDSLKAVTQASLSPPDLLSNSPYVDLKGKVKVTNPFQGTPAWK